jgi:P4 family phage/plasmid primase-like protien
MRSVSVSIGDASKTGGTHNARIKKIWTGSFERFCELMIKNVPESTDKASAGWVCGATFDPLYRDSENFVERHLLSLDYDHIAPGELDEILQAFMGHAFVAFTTFSHIPSHPRIRVWMPLSRPCGYDEFQAVSRAVAARAGIERAARESHVPAQYMFRPTVKPFEEFRHWENAQAPWLDVDQILGEYDDWTDRKSWPHRSDGDGVHSAGEGSIDPRTKPGIIGAFCRAFTIPDAIEHFGLPYTRSGTEGRWTYTAGSRPEGAIIYDDETKLHSHHDTDPARGQSNAYDLVRLHRYGAQDQGFGARPVAERPSTRAMLAFALSEGAVVEQLPRIRAEEEFEDLGPLISGDPSSGTVAGATPIPALPERIVKPSSRLTDLANARRIQRKFGNKILVVGNKFYYWSERYWEQNEAPVHKHITKLSGIVKAEAEALNERLSAALPAGDSLSKEQVQQINQVYGWARECAQRAKLDACEAILRKQLVFDAKALNKSPHLFSCANGTIDLRSGEIREHDLKDFITACSPTVFDPEAQAPRFQQFLREIYIGDEEVVQFAKRWFGYCITGETNEHKMIFHVGRGGNGKSTIMTLMNYVLGSGYYSTSPQKILALDESGATPDLAALMGKRMVTIAETDETLELREGLVKQITSGDAINARKLYQEPFEFLPTHKLQVFTNFSPAVKSQDFAMWRRILLLNYPMVYGDPAQVASGEALKLRDSHLDEALRGEAPGVLAWLVEGAKEWYANGLQPAKAVLETTRKYRAEQDNIGQFVRERVIVAADARVALTGQAESIFPAYRGWCTTMNCRPLGRTKFIREILRVVPSAREATVEGSQGFAGIKLTSTDLMD